MRLPLLFLAAVACQSAQTDGTETAATAGTTTVARGTPTVTRSDTTRTSGGAVQGSSDEVQLTVDRTSYTPGGTVTMRIVSRSRDTLGYNQCSSRAVERQEGNNWVAQPEPSRMCTMELRLLMPNETQSATTDLPATLPAGTYRLVLTLGRQRSPRAGEPGSAGSVRAVSPSFRVT
jgi:hypothetical protein